MKRSFAPIGLLVAVLFCTLTLTGCAEGWKASDKLARQWLPGAIPNLKRVVILLRTCQPRRRSGYNDIWADGWDGGGRKEPPHCAFGSDKGIAEIQSQLRQARVLGVMYSPSGSPNKRINFANFILFREGLAVAGSIISVTYSAEPQRCEKTNEPGEYPAQTSPIGSPPCRWFWERSEG